MLETPELCVGGFEDEGFSQLYINADTQPTESVGSRSVTVYNALLNSLYARVGGQPGKAYARSKMLHTRLARGVGQIQVSLRNAPDSLTLRVV